MVSTRIKCTGVLFCRSCSARLHAARAYTQLAYSHFTHVCACQRPVISNLVIWMQPSSSSFFVLRPRLVIVFGYSLSILNEVSVMGLIVPIPDKWSICHEAHRPHSRPTRKEVIAVISMQTAGYLNLFEWLLCCTCQAQYWHPSTSESSVFSVSHRFRTSLLLCKPPRSLVCTISPVPGPYGSCVHASPVASPCCSEVTFSLLHGVMLGPYVVPGRCHSSPSSVCCCSFYILRCSCPVMFAYKFKKLIVMKHWTLDSGKAIVSLTYSG